MDISVSRPKLIFRISAACFALISFVQFLIYYICMGFFYESDAAIIIAPFLIDFIEGLIPIGAAVIIFLTKSGGLKSKILPAVLISLPRLCHTIPYYYIYYVSDVFNSIEAITLSLFVSFFYILFSCLQTFICIYLINYSISRSQDKNIRPAKTKIFDFENPFNFGILLSVIFIFVIFFARELIDTITFFIEVGGSYYAEEILTIVLSYVMLPAFALLSYSLSVFTKNKLVKKDAE